jgi:putative tricarboxylic transport membrane protein
MDLVLAGFGAILSFKVISLLFVGTAVGILFGALPGVSVTMGVALFLPMTFGMDPITALSMLIGVYIGGTSGGLISAILLKIPGTASSIATCWDGHPMAQKGEAGKALGVGIVYSAIGTIIGLIVLMVMAPALTKIAINFGPYEYFAVAIFSLTMIAGLSSGSLVKGMISGGFGLLIAMVGAAPIDAFPRFTMGIHDLDAGVSILPALIGLFAVTEIFKAAESKNNIGKEEVRSFKIKGFGFSMKEFLDQKVNALVSALVGVGIGILPGIGGGTANIIAYTVSQNTSKHPEKYGTGIIDGIVASETSNNACVGGALIPLLTLGIPGDNVTAILLGGFMIHGIAPGPLLMTTQGKLLYAIFAAMFVSTLFMVALEFGGMRIFVRLLQIPKYILFPVIMALCTIGAFGLNNRVFDIWVALFFGVFGFILEKFKFPTAPLILGFILGPLAELNLRRGLMKSDGSFLPFVTSPIAAVFLTFALISIIVTVRGNIKKSRAANASISA